MLTHLIHLSNETAKNYEIGLKNEFFEHRLRGKERGRPRNMRLNSNSRWMVSRQPFSDFVEGFVSLDDTYTTAFTEDAPPIPATLLYSVTQRAYNLLGAQFGADLAGGHYRVAAAGINSSIRRDGGNHN